MIDKAEAWETLDLLVLKLELLNAGGGWLSSSAGRSTISGSDFEAGSREAEATGDGTTAEVESAAGAVIRATSDTIESVVKYWGVNPPISCSRGGFTNVEPPALCGRNRLSRGERPRILNSLFSDE